MSHTDPMGPLDDPGAVERDPGFLGFRSRVRPAKLPPGVARYIENMRLDNETARVRAGTKALSTDLSLPKPPLVLDLVLGEDIAVTSMTRTGSVVTVETSVAHGGSVGDLVAVEGAVETDYNGDWEIIAPVGEFELRFDIGSATPTTPATGTITVNRGPELREDYANEVRASLEYADSDNAEGVVLVTELGAYVYREGEASAEIAYPAGQTVPLDPGAWLVQAGGYVFLFRGPDDYVMKWDMDVTHDFVRVTNGTHPNGGTFIYTPNVAWGVLWVRQLIIPYARTQFLRSGFDEYETFDTLYSQQNIKSGGDDWLMFAHGYQKQRVLVMFRKSLHIARFSAETMAPVSVDKVSDQAGLVARRSVAECGPFIVFLSDNGLQVVRILDDLELVLAPVPLSEPVQDLFNRINAAAAHKAVGRYWNNRYYLAVPLDDATTNNVVLVFNFLNRTSGDTADPGFYGEWESVDTFQGSFDVQNFLVLGYAGKRRLHYATTYGFVFLAEELEADEWGNNADAIAESTIVGKLHTRYYFGQTTGEKRQVRAGIDVETFAAGDTVTITVGSRNRDRTQRLEDYVATAAGDATVERRLRGLRGVAGYVDIETGGGRPEIKGIELEATAPGNKRSTRE